LWLATVRASEGYALMLRGRKAEALRAYEDGLRAEGEDGQYSLWFVGRLALELGKREEAERAFRALWAQRDGVPARLQLARLLEKSGRPAEARAAYQYIVYAWRDADPELQPVVADARAAVERLE
ncbi:MAG TPA: hypothetical protein VFL95_12260, partial [Gemmatimonadales bacterium]|nr:hypothetical protein [Gemmatimonadales bacterium]